MSYLESCGMRRHRSRRCAFIIAIIVLSISSPTASQQSCSVMVYGADVLGRPMSTTRVNDGTFVVTSKFVIAADCGGYRITSWNYWRSSDTSVCYTMIGQVWRPTSSNTLQLVGQNILQDALQCSNTAGSGQSITVPISPGEQIPVQAGDFIGWTDIGASAKRMLLYDEALPGSAQYSSVAILSRTDSCESTVVGATCSLQNARQTVRDYSIQATIQPGAAPVILNLPATVNVNELSGPWSIVYHVLAHNNFTSTATVPPPLSYSISSTLPSQCSTVFAINSTTGVVVTTTQVTLPASTLCELKVLVQQGQLSNNSGILTVTVDNVNTPHNVTNLPAQVDIDLNSFQQTPVQSLYNVTVSDSDVGVVYTFSLFMLEQNYNHLFTITPTAGEVRTTTSLYEYQGPAILHANITVSDGWYVTGPDTLTMNLLNKRSAPSVMNLPATVTVSEDVIVSTSVYTLTPVSTSRPPVVDYDYMLVSCVPATGLNTFSVLNSPSYSGVVVLQQPLDYIVTSEYVLTVSVQDGYMLGPEQNLTVVVGHVNQAPVFTVTQYTSDITETQSVGAVLPDVILQVTDRDDSCGDWYNFYTNDSLFIASNLTNQLSTTRVMTSLSPGVTSQRYDVAVTVYDSCGATDSALVSVIVSDVNDHAPQFSQSQYNGSVLDVGPGGSWTGVMVFASDDDSAQNAQITYTIADTDMLPYFEVNSTGHVILKQPIIASVYNNVSLVVLAVDGGVPVLNDTAGVFIDVIATNCHHPHFNNTQFHVERRSNLDLSTVLTTVTAFDLDPESVNNVSYMFVVPQQQFSIDSKTGDVRAQASLSSFTEYQLYIEALDTSPTLTYYSDVVLLVIDTYDASDQLIDITLSLTVSELEPSVDEFIALLSDLVQPWTVKLESMLYTEDDRSVVRVYAVDATLSSQSSSQSQIHFIFRNDLLDKLRTDLYGTPCDELLTGEFAEYGVVSVEAVDPNWALETPEGIATLTVSCFVAAVLLVVATVLLLRAFKLCCFKPSQVVPSDVTTETVLDDFDLHSSASLDDTAGHSKAQHTLDDDDDDDAVRGQHAAAAAGTMIPSY